MRPRVRFGTSGWRGVLGDGFGFEGARALCRAVAERARDQAPGRPVLVAHDTRFLGEVLAEEGARVVAGAGVRVLRARGPLATPVATWAVRQRGAAAGILFTASHNPPEYQGIKVVAPWGGAAPEGWTRDLERRAAAVLRTGSPSQADPSGARRDLRAPYLRALSTQLDAQAIRRARVGVAFDAMHGAGAGTLDRVLRDLGASVETLHAEPDPRFGGQPPDPAPARLERLARRTRAGRDIGLGLATDGDGDRFAALDEKGRLLSESDGVALLVDHLARTGRATRGVAISVATGSLVERVAAEHRLPVERHPIGFVHLTRALDEGRADVAGEESGGFAWAPLARDKDGILAGCLLAELVAVHGSLATRLRALERRHGRRVCGRIALAAGRDPRSAVARVRQTLSPNLDGARVGEVSSRDGLRVVLDDGFLMLRASGTEPVLRVYAEAPSKRALDRRLSVGIRLLRRAGIG